MALQKISGLISHFRQETMITGSQTGRTGASTVHSDNVINFRVDGQPVALKLKKVVDLTNGEQASVVGKSKNGVLQGIAIRNDETGVIYALATWHLLVLGVVITLLSIPLIPILVGLFGFPLGIWLIVKGVQNHQALDMLSELVEGTVQ